MKLLSTLSLQALWSEHIALWQWLARTGHAYKQRYPPFDQERIETPTNYCFLCEIAERIAEEYPACYKCPIDWNTTYNRCNDSGSLYNLWQTAQTLEGRKRWALALCALKPSRCLNIKHPQDGPQDGP